MGFTKIPRCVCPGQKAVKLEAFLCRLHQESNSFLPTTANLNLRMHRALVVAHVAASSALVVAHVATSSALVVARVAVSSMLVVARVAVRNVLATANSAS